MKKDTKESNSVTREFLTAPFIAPYVVRLSLGWTRYNGTLRGFEFKDSVCERAEIARSLDHVKLRRFALTASQLEITFVEKTNKTLQAELDAETERVAEFNRKIDKNNSDLIDMSRKKIRPKDYKPDTGEILAYIDEPGDIVDDISDAEDSAPVSEDERGDSKKTVSLPRKSKPKIKRGK